jgi:branched-chain amino acid transport system substrate-binding protein
MSVFLNELITYLGAYQIMKRRNLVIAAPAFAIAGVPSAWAAKEPSSASNNLVQFGLSASLTGGQASYGKDVRDGLLAAFAAANRSAGLRFELLSLDDAGDREKCKANVKNLIDSGVSALVGLTSGAAAEACLPMVEEAQIVMVGTATGNMGIRSNKTTMSYHARAGYDSEYRQIVRYIKGLGMKRVGYVFLKDTSAANQAAMTVALDDVGMKPTLTLPIDRNAKSFTAEAESLLAAKLDAVFFSTNAAPAEVIIAHMAAAKYMGTFFSSSFAGQSLITAMGKQRVSIIMSQVVPRPASVAIALVKRYREDLAALGGDAKIGYTSLEGYIAGRVAVEGARAAAATGPVSRLRFKSALSDLNLDLGGYTVRFGGGNKHGSKFVDIVAIDRRGKIIG